MAESDIFDDNGDDYDGDSVYDAAVATSMPDSWTSWIYDQFYWNLSTALSI